MTTNEQADRIKGLVAGLRLAASGFPTGRPGAMTAMDVPEAFRLPMREAAEALQALQTRAEDAERNLSALIRAYDHAITVTVGEGGRRSWHMKASKLAVAFDLARSLSAASLTPPLELGK